MSCRAIFLVGIVSLALASKVAAQTPPTVDFGRDVLPILRERCYVCHGPEQQMNGFRLDRRADAMRGGTQAVIGPGNAEGSRFYRRLIDTTAGARMPPTGPLRSHEIATLKAWIDQGAVWPDEVSGEVPVPPVDPDAERLATLVRDGDRDSIHKLLHMKPLALIGRTAGGSTPLMFAGLYGDSALVQHFLRQGADPGIANVAGATALMWAVPSVDEMRLLLNAGANVDARSEDGRTALSIAAGITGATPAVKLLLEYGASPFPARGNDPLPLREAVRADNAAAFQLLLDYGADPKRVSADYLRANCFACAVALGVGGAGPLPAHIEPVDTGLRPTVPSSPPPRMTGSIATTAGSVRRAAARALAALQPLGPTFIEKTGCVSCHNNSVVAMAVAAARRNGYRVNEEIAGKDRLLTARYLESWRERTLQNQTIAGGKDSVGYVLFGLSVAGHVPDRATDAQAFWLLRRQSADGRWTFGGSIRPPIESNDTAITALAVRAIRRYAHKSVHAEAAQAVARARDWLASTTGEATEERAFRVLGLVWAAAKPNAIATAVRALQASQRPDGGWAQLSSMESDAYATGEALVALQESGAVSRRDPSIRRGVAFLFRTQLEDASWFVKSRSVPIQVYFESGFPHGADQWISAAASAWAVTALVQAGER